MKGPQLDPMGERKSLARLRTELDHEMLAPIYQTIERVKAEQGPFCETVSAVAAKAALRLQLRDAPN